MKLREVILKNFRAYSEETRIPIDDLTALIGKNDVGKSTILEALDVFFNLGKMDLKDKHVEHKEDETVIGCIFDDLPTTITLEDVSTSFSREYLLNEDGNLEIWKKYSTAGKEVVYIRALHPSNDGFDDLLSKKNKDLKDKIHEEGLEDQVNLTINSEMRVALWNSLGASMIQTSTFIEADKADEKRLWPKIVPLLPTFRLFKADRPSTDEDEEAQDPMKHAIELAISDQQVQLNEIARVVQEKVLQVAENTIEKLKDFDPNLAANLIPEFKKDPVWEKAFSFTLTGENEIPLNKRGSGVRRLVLFSFFRASTESELFDGKNIIYAVEEPETSQHPGAQKKIVDAFRNMTEKNNCQVIITTHEPGLAGYIPTNSLRYITDGEGYPEVACGNDDEGILKRIANTLGVFSDITPALATYRGVKLIVCMEGPTDIEFLKAISRTAHQFDASIIDLNLTPDVVMIPLGGSTLKDWVNHDYLQKLCTPEYHIYDSDNTMAHAAECDRINGREDSSSARMTQKREIENYIHSDVVQEIFGVQIEINDTMDVSTEISNLIRARNPEGFTPQTVKKKLSKIGAQKMTIELLRSRDPDDEVLGWLREITAMVTGNAGNIGTTHTNELVYN